MIEGALQIAHRIYELRKKRDRLDSRYQRLMSKAVKVADKINKIEKEIHMLDY